MKETNNTAPATEATVIAEFPCSQTQLRCWILDQLKPGNPALNVAVRWEIRGAFRSSTLEAAFRTVIQRHEILRTRFVEVGGRPCQQVVDQVDFRMSVIDLRNVPVDQRDQRILSIGEETARAPFDLSSPYLFRVSLLMVENERGFLLITAHQSCFDGWSIRVLGREVGEIASALDAGRQPAVPELPLQYGDFSLWQQEYLGSYGFETEKSFWREQLTGAPYFEVVPDTPRGPVKTSRGNILSVNNTGDFSERIDAAARAHRVSLYSFGAAVVSALLQRYTGKNTVMFGSQVAGRDETDLENLIGVFINNVVLRFDMGGDITFAEHVRSAGATVTAALNHHRMPFNKLVELVNPVRDPSRNPLISVNFNLQKAFLEDHQYGGFELLSAPSQSPGVIYDLSFIMIGRPSGWRMSIEYNADLFEKTTIESLLRLWQDAYEMALTQPTAPLSALTIPPREIKAQPVETGRATAIEQMLAAHPSVGSVAVLIDEDGKRAHAFVTPAPTITEPLDRLPEFLMDYLGRQLSQSAMPGGISVLLNLPRDASGTVDRTALRIPAPPPAVAKPVVDRLEPEATPGPAPAPTDQTKALAAIWAEVLGVPTIAPDDNFFALGGHSLLALRMLSGARSKLGAKADLELLFKEPTFGGFAKALFGGTEPRGTELEGASASPWIVSACGKTEAPYTLYTLNHPFLYYRLATDLGDSVSVYNANMFHADLTGDLASLSLGDRRACRRQHGHRHSQRTGWRHGALRQRRAGGRNCPPAAPARRRSAFHGGHRCLGAWLCQVAVPAPAPSLECRAPREAHRLFHPQALFRPSRLCRLSQGVQLHACLPPAPGRAGGDLLPGRSRQCRCDRSAGQCGPALPPCSDEREVRSAVSKRSHPSPRPQAAFRLGWCNRCRQRGLRPRGLA